MKKRIAALIALLAFSMTTANASILGSLLIHSDKINIGNGLNLHNNVFLSDQKGVGNQTEYYAEYTPNKDVVPVVITGEEIYGKRTASEIMEYMQKNSMVPMLGINASFFSFTTGIPMGHVITDGVVTSKDNRTLAGVGFKADGTAFIEDLCIETSVSFGEDYVLQIPHINKFISKETQITTLYTSDFGDKTGTSTKTINVILENVTDEVKIGKEFTCTVKEIVTSDLPLAINDGEMIISVNTAGNQWAITLINAMRVGEELTFKTTATSQIWNEAENGLASEGARLLTGGVVNNKLEAGAAPRTAVGIKADGTVIFYVLDGRQTGYSYGAKQKTVAERLKELGCVDALNLDGGGSTTMSGVYPGCDKNVIINSPSEKTLRKVTNFIFLKNTKQPTGNPAHAYIYPYSGKILSGSTISLSTKAVDENYYPVSVSSVEYSANEYATITPDGQLTALGEGTVVAEVMADGATGKAEFQTYLTPDAIKIYNADNSKELTDIDAAAGDTFRLYAKAFYKGIEMMSSNDAFRWSTSDDKATVNENGVLTISEFAKSDITLTVKAGAYSRDYKIKLPKIEENVFADTNTHWAKDIIAYMNEKGVVNGSIDNGQLVYRPDDKVTRAEFAIMVSNFMGYELQHFSDVSLDAFEDADKIPEWAIDQIKAVYKNGIINGKDNNGKLYFEPNVFITRAEAVTMISRMLPELIEMNELTFTDANEIPDWSADAFKKLTAARILKGYDDNTVKPKNNVTRAEAVTMLYNIY